MPTRSLPMPQDSDAIICIGSKHSRRFYEPVVLLQALLKAIPSDEYSRRSESRPNLNLEPEEAFKWFVNKLAQLCDNRRCGPTVTSFVIMQEPRGVVYAFGSNQRSAAELEQTKEFITKLLRILRNEGSTHRKALGLPELKESILDHALEFSHPRLGFYVARLRKELECCIASINANAAATSKDEQAIKTALEYLAHAASFEHGLQMTDNNVRNSYKRLLRIIRDVDESPIRAQIERRAKEDRLDRSKPWCELRHFVGRLLSFYRAINVLVDAPRQWPSLFHDPTVHAIPSSKAIPSPLGRKSFTAANIVGRLSSDHSIIARHREHASQLQFCGLDSLIKEECVRPGFRPILHSEVLVLDWIRSGGHVKPARFFNGWKYIGCSKPTCRLCDYYFQAGGRGVQVRPSHCNVYTSWRVPDIFASQGPDAVRERDRVLDRVLDQVRRDACRTLDERTSERKRYDSNTSSIAPYRRNMNEDMIGDCLSTHFEGLELDATYKPDLTQQRHVEVLSEDELEAPVSGTYSEDDDSDSGGARLD